jgi:hypothetical protein
MQGASPRVGEHRIGPGLHEENCEAPVILGFLSLTEKL